MRIGRGARTVAVAIAALLLAGCSEIPLAGPVGIGRTESPEDPAIVFLPAAPAPGAKPADIVSGFVQAASGAGNGYAVAKQYLTKDFAADWRPNDGVLVYGKAPEVVATGRESFELQVQTVARVEPDGTYTPSVQSLRMPFRLQQVGGQWRIAEAENGIVLAQTVFERTFSPRTLEFFDPAWTRLVPDVRWFAKGAKETAVVRSLLRGPAGALSAGVTSTAFPPGSTLQGLSGEVDGSTTVVLAVPGAQPARRMTDRMQQQLARSLQIQQPDSLRLVVNGTVAPTAPVLTVQGAAQVPVVYADGRFGTLQSSGAVSEDAVLGKRVAALRPTSVTVSSRQRLAAVRARNGNVVIVGATGNPRVVDDRPGLTAPTIDQRAWTYSVPADDPAGLIAVSSAGRVVRLPATTLGGTEVTKIEVSPDGTRLLVLVRRVAESVATVAGIQRSADGTPTGLSTDQYPLTVPSGKATDATWIDDASVAILTSGNDGSDTVTAQQVGGLTTPIGRLSNATSIVGTSSKVDLRARDTTGNVLEPSTSAVWQNVFPTAVDVDVLAVQR